MNEQQNVELKLIHMEDVVSKEVEWLWYPYIPYGKITIIESFLITIKQQKQQKTLIMFRSLKIS